MSTATLYTHASGAETANGNTSDIDTSNSVELAIDANISVVSAIATTLYGSSVLDGTLTTASDMAPTTGGSETSKTTTTSGTNQYGEIFSQGGSTTGASSIPGTPSGKGWVFRPGACNLIAGNWSANVTLSSAGWGGSPPGNANITIRFFKYSSGIYTLIGTINAGLSGTAKTNYAFTATAMPAVSFGSNDLLYVDLWWFDGGNIAGDNPVVYESSSSSNGVANDMQVSSSVFSPTLQLFFDRKGADGVYYQIWNSSAVTATGTVSDSIGAGLNKNQSLGATGRFRWTITGLGASFTFSASLQGK